MALDISSLYGSVYGLGQGSASRGLSGIAGVGQASAFNSLGAAALNRNASSYQVQLSAYGKLRSALDEFKGVLGGYKSAQDVAPFKAASSNTAVLSAKAGKNISAAAAYSVQVTRLAQAQNLTSAAYADADSTIVGSGSMILQTGSYNPVSNTFSPADPVGKTISISASNGTLSGIAIAINEAGAGVKASVVKSGSNYQLSLTSTQTGTDNTIKLRVFDNDGTNGDLSGLSALAYDPTLGPSGYGKNMTEAVSAGNAELTVDGAGFISQSNTVTEAVKDLTFDLVATGSAKVTVAHDPEAFEAAAKRLVDAYNNLQKSLSEAAGASFASGTGLVSQLDKDLRGAVAQAASGSRSSQATLAAIGISIQADGMLALDKDKLQGAFAADQETASSVIADAAAKMGTVISRSGDTYNSIRPTSFGQSDRGYSSMTGQRYDTRVFFGMPVQSLFSYISRFNTAAQARLYGHVASL